MITDEWNGLGVYKTDDYTHWERNGVILRDGGKRPLDGVMANHADVVISGDNAYIFYFTHPFHSNENRLNRIDSGENAFRTCIQVAKLESDGKLLTCDRDAEFELNLIPPLES